MKRIFITKRDVYLIGLAGFFIGLLFCYFLKPKKSEFIVRAAEVAVIVEATPNPTLEPKTYAKVTAYSCGGLTTDAEIEMNCPSLKDYPEGRTSGGTTPRPYITAACDRANMGRTFHIDGVGEVVCEDTGGAIRGTGRFDLYVTDVQEARKWGVQTLEYSEVK